MGSGYSPGIKTERDDGSELLSGLTGLDSPARAGGARAPVAATLLEALQGVKLEFAMADDQLGFMPERSDSNRICAILLLQTVKDAWDQQEDDP